jgi:hypothetical protein
MPVLSTTDVSCGQVFDPPVRGIRGIPLQFYVRPLARQGGVYVDMPKGFQFPTCLVEPCCPPEEPAPE